MTTFRRSLFGYNRRQVTVALAERDARAWALERDAADCCRREAEAVAAAAVAEAEMASLSEMVLEREREIRLLNRQLSEVNARHDRSIASLDAISARLEEIQAQARGQATRIRMKALREAVEVSRRVQALTDAHPAAGEVGSGANGSAPEPAYGVFEGEVRLEIGPLGDFSQLVGFEDAVGRIGASEISVERFSEGRATFSMRLDEPTELLRELEELSSLDFRVRHTAPDNLVLDVDEDAGDETRSI